MYFFWFWKIIKMRIMKEVTIAYVSYLIYLS